MSAKPFLPIADSNPKYTGGHAGGDGLRFTALGEEVFGKAGAQMGPRMACYLLRRFGWPNEGSDDHKNLCSWVLTTPMPGVWLSVTPYLGDGHHHFAIRFNRKVESALRADPVRDAFWRRKETAARHWWQAHGRKLYTFGSAMPSGGAETLVKQWEEHDKVPGEVLGLWLAKPEHPAAGKKLPWGNSDGFMAEWIAEFVKEKHPDHFKKFPKWNPKRMKRRLTRHHLAVIRALKATMRALLCPTNVRDIYFNPLGSIEHDKAAMPYAKLPHAAPFAGAGNTPKYWFTTAREGRNKKALQ